MKITTDHVRSVLLMSSMGICVVTFAVLSNEIKLNGLKKFKRYERIVIDITDFCREVGARILVEELGNYYSSKKRYG